MLFVAVTNENLDECCVVTVDFDDPSKLSNDYRFYRKFNDENQARLCVVKYIFERSRDEIAGSLYLISELKLRIEELKLFDPDDVAGDIANYNSIISVEGQKVEKIKSLRDKAKKMMV